MNELNERNQQSSDLGDVLVVDDAPANLRLLSVLLRREGYSVRCTISGEMALRSVQVLPPDLVLLDINMPQMDGYEVCQRLKADPVTAEIPVIFVSVLDSFSEQDHALAMGGMDYIAKPYAIQDVLNKVRRALGKNRFACNLG
jgi:CheY-like chemotaxis protein